MTSHCKPITTAVVFALKDMGVRCLEALIELGVEVRLVVTRPECEFEQMWFESVEEMARKNGLSVITPDNPNSQDVIERVARSHPDYIFAFHYDEILNCDLLEIPTNGAFSIHSSLLPKYCGSAPINWAIINGEKECGVSLHRMEDKAGAGDLIGQRAIPILTNDTAIDIFHKLKYVAESMLLDIVPEMIAGRVLELPQNSHSDSCLSVRKLEDGRIDWSKSAKDIHNLVRALAPPFPGAYFYCDSHRIEISGSVFRGEQARHPVPCIYVENGFFWADCACGQRFMISELRINASKISIRESFKGSVVDLWGEHMISDNFAIEPILI